MYSNNIAGSADVGFSLEGGIGKCSVAHDMKAYACRIGVNGNPYTKNLYYKRINIIDSLTGLRLSSRGKGTDVNAYVEDSYISAVERTSCSFCYG